MAGIKLAAGAKVRMTVTWPASAAPYFPSWVNLVAEDDDEVLYSRGEFKCAWSQTASGYGNASGIVIAYNSDGTWEAFDVGPPYRLIMGGTYTVLPPE